MDPVTGDVMRERAVEGVAGAATHERRHWARPQPRVQEPSHLRLERPSDARLQLQRRGPANLGHPLRRAVVRFLVLVVADLASFGVMRAVVRAVRDYSVVGQALAQRVEAIVPTGILNGWQYAAALLMGLLVTGNYGRGDQRRNPRRLFLGAALATALPLWMAIWTRGLEPVLVQYVLVTVLVWIGLLLERQTINRIVTGVRPATVWRRGQALVELTAPSLKGWQLALKRLMDVAGATIGLVLLSPVFALLAVLVKLESAGPVFFQQERVGGGGRRFRIVKFRTMVDGAEKRRDELLSRSLYTDPRLFKMPNDPRITPLGRWLRRTSLDELPQLVNVLRGEMSLVGPRPPLPSEVALYGDHHYARFDVKPGMTGPWQVAGRNGVTAFEEVIGLETAYIQNWSVWADLKLLLRTVPVVVRMDGAF